MFFEQKLKFHEITSCLTSKQFNAFGKCYRCSKLNNDVYFMPKAEFLSKYNILRTKSDFIIQSYLTETHLITVI